MSGTHQHLDLERLARILAMGGSEHDGEVLAAFRQAERSIRAGEMTWHDVLLPGQLIEALTAEVQQLRDELTTMRADKAAEIQRLHVALAAVGRRRRPTHQRRPVGIIILGFLVAMYVISDVIISSCLWHGSRRKFAARAQRNCTGGHSRAVYLHSKGSRLGSTSQTGTHIKQVHTYAPEWKFRRGREVAFLSA